jgi:hypothetical protein
MRLDMILPRMDLGIGVWEQAVLARYLLMDGPRNDPFGSMPATSDAEKPIKSVIR